MEDFLFVVVDWCARCVPFCDFDSLSISVTWQRRSWAAADDARASVGGGRRWGRYANLLSASVGLFRRPYRRCFITEVGHERLIAAVGGGASRSGRPHTHKRKNQGEQDKNNETNWETQTKSTTPAPATLTNSPRRDRDQHGGAA